VASHFVRSVVGLMRRIPRADRVTTSAFDLECPGQPWKDNLMNIALWIVAGLLAVGSLAGGALKLILPKNKLAASGWGWVEDFSAGTVRSIGTLEILAAVGLILPAVLDIAPILVPAAAAGLALLLIGATVTHLRRHEATVMVVPLALLALSVFVAVGRFGPQPFTL
jgi:hypothetical protein